MNQTKLLFPLIFISLEDEPWEPIEPNPNAAPAEEPVAAEPGLSESDWTLASTETVTHEYLTQNGRVGVIGTAATMRSGAYEKYLHKKDGTLRLYTQACPLFVPLVENGRVHRGDIVIETVAAEYLAPLKEAGVDTLILGCTHYPLLEEVISDYMGPDVTLIDSGAEAANLASTQFNPNDGPGGTRYYVSDDPAGFDRLAGLFLQEDVETNAGLVDISRF